MNLEGYIKDLSPELQEKARACSSVQELLALAKEEKVPLPDEVLAAIAGGDDDDSVGCGDPPKCPKCGSGNVFVSYDIAQRPLYQCQDCGYSW